MPLQHTVIARPRTLSDILKWEAFPDYNREVCQILAGAGAKRAITFGMVVAATAAGKIVQLAPAASDGTQNVFGVALNDADADDGADSDPNALLILRRGPALVAGSQLIFPAGITAPQRAAAVTQLTALGIVLRD